MDIEQAYQPNEDSEVEALVASFVNRVYNQKAEGYKRVAENIWLFSEPEWEFNLVITSKLIIFDGLLFTKFPEKKTSFFQELLTFNAHQSKQCKVCLVKEETHLRLIKEHAHYTYEEFTTNLDEFRWQYPQVRSRFGLRYFAREEV